MRIQNIRWIDYPTSLDHECHEWTNNTNFDSLLVRMVGLASGQFFCHE